MDNLDSFIQATKNVRLSSEERSSVRRTLLTAFVERKRSDLLSELEKDDLRSSLREFMLQNPLRSRTVRLADETPSLTPWLGVNLFGCLKPFAI